MLTLDTAMDIARTHESALSDMDAFQSEASLTTHQVKQRREDGKQRKGRRGNCTNCNRQHPTGKCPASNSKCRACGQLGHWEAACRSKSTTDGPTRSSQNTGQGDEAINMPSTSCASMKTATMMTHSNTWNLTA